MNNLNVDNEIWRDVRGYEGLYQVSNQGRVKSFPNRYQPKSFKENNGILKQDSPQGYPYVTLYKNRKAKHVFVHRLVAEAFIPNNDSLPFVNHKDENTSNNKVDNLEWCTHSYNINYGTRNKRCGEKQGVSVVQMDLQGNVICTYKTMQNAAKAVGACNHSHISQVCHGMRNTAYGFTWKINNIKK